MTIAFRLPSDQPTFSLSNTDPFCFSYYCPNLTTDQLKIGVVGAAELIYYYLRRVELLT